MVSSAAVRRYPRPRMSSSSDPRADRSASAESPEFTPASSQAIREETARLRERLRSSRECVLRLDIEGRVEEWDERASEITGYATDEIVGRHFSVFYTQEEKRRGRPDAELRVARELGVFTEDRWRERADGSWFWASEVLMPCRSREGEHTGYQKVLRDLSEQHRVQEALLESEEDHRLLFESAPLGIVSKDEKGRFRRVNPAFEEIFGYSARELHSRDWFDLIHPDDVDTLRRLFTEAVTGERAGYSAEGRLRRSDDNFVWVRVTDHAIRDGDGEFLRNVCIIEDVSQRRRAERELREREERARLVGLVTRDSLWDWNLGNNEVRRNEAVQTTFGYGPDARRQSIAWWEARIHPDDRERVTREIQRVIEGEGVWSDEYRFQRADGSYATVFDRGYVMRDDEGRPVRMVGAMGDVSRLRDLEQQFRHAQKMAAIGRLAGGVAHDFNNLLTAITGFALLLRADTDQTDPRTEYIEEIRRAADRSASLTQQLLAFSRQQVLQPQTFDLNEAVAGMTPMLERLIGENIELVTPPDSAPLPIRADRAQIEQVIVNLAVNARDAMPDGGVLVLATERRELVPEHSPAVRELPPSLYSVLAVADTGTGIEPHIHTHIFDPFFTTKEVGKGTGLGLSTVHGIVQQSGGTITVESIPNRGTRFEVLLPLIAGGEVVEVSSAEKMTTAESGTGGRCVLLAEDEHVVRRLARRVLEDAGYTVIDAADAYDALRHFDEHRGTIDLLLTDVLMPGMSGTELAQRLQRRSPGLRVLFTSGYPDRGG